MPPESSGPTELDDAKWPVDDGWPDDGAADERDPDWPEDTAEERDPDWPDDWPDDGGEDPPWPRAAPPAAYGRDRGPGRRGLRPLALAAVAVVALGAGAGVALAITRGLDHSASPSATSISPPSNAVPGGGGTVPGGGSGAAEQMFVTGPVTAVSSTSITIGGGPGHSVTAAITSSTRITGQVTSIAEIKIGEEVSAQITVSGSGKATVTAIQDPAQAPSGGSLP
jgi:hypothetical protein